VLNQGYDSDGSSVASSETPEEEYKIGAKDRVTDCQCDKCKLYNLEHQIFDRLPFSLYDNIDPNGNEPITEHQYFLCESHVTAFILKERRYGKNCIRYE
jgi:hypothetical protein